MLAMRLPTFALRALRALRKPGTRAIAIGLSVLAGFAHAAEDRPAAEEAPGPTRFVYGIVRGVASDDQPNLPIDFAMVTIFGGNPAYFTTVYSDERGRFISAPLPHLPKEGTDTSSGLDGYSLRVRRVGFEDFLIEDLDVGEGVPLLVEMTRHSDPGAVAAQLPANHWFARVLERIQDPAERLEMKQQCTYCHQQGNWATRRARTEVEWQKLIRLMGTRGGMISRSLRNRLPEIFREAYEPGAAVADLVGDRFAEASRVNASRESMGAVIEEWQLGGGASRQHDVMVHPDGRIYSVDGPQDQLHRLDLSTGTGIRETWTIPHGDLPPGGVFASSSRETTTSEAFVAPHSLQTAPDGSVWITLASGNQLARFDVDEERFEIHEVEHGIYPHTLRFDQRGRIWYTMAATNHIGFFDPVSLEQRHVRLPARSLTQALILRMTPFFLKVGRLIDIRGAAADGDGIKMPVPYGIDIGPDGGVWFSQLNEHKIGRIDPESFEYEMIPTPFETPRRIRFAPDGRLWIPSFSESLITRFDPETRAFETWDLPIEPFGTETPYALAVAPETGHIWICGTNSDTMIRFEPEHERFTVYPLPTRVTYTREVDFDQAGRVWTSNSNSPTWQIERGVPNVIRIDPDGATIPNQSELFGRGTEIGERNVVSGSLQAVGQ